MGVPLSGVQESYSFLQKCDMFTGFPGIEKRIFYKKTIGNFYFIYNFDANKLHLQCRTVHVKRAINQHVENT